MQVELTDRGYVTCFLCELEIEGDVWMCPANCICQGTEGKIIKNGVLIGRIGPYKTPAHHATNDQCIEALKKELSRYRS